MANSINLKHYNTNVTIKIMENGGSIEFYCMYINLFKCVRRNCNTIIQKKNRSISESIRQFEYTVYNFTKRDVLIKCA